MRTKHPARWTTGLLLALLTTRPGAGHIAAEGPDPQGTPQDRPTFSVQIDLVTTDVVARDTNGNFVSDLTKDDFDVYEDGVKQQIVSLTLSHGGRVSNLLAPPPPPAPEGIILPPARRTNDTSGRIFVFFIDDLHLQFQNMPRIRTILRKAGKALLHDGDLFGIVSTGTSSISIQPTYDTKRFDEIVDKVSGDELKPDEIINGPTGQDGPAEVRHRARVALDTVNELLDNLEKLHDRRKAIVYVSDGYDFIPFQNARLGLNMDVNSPFLLNQQYRDTQSELQSQGQCDAAQGVSTTDPNPTGSLQKQKEEFADADLARELAQLTRNANRANATIYTIDPRGLVGTPDLDEPVEPRQWSEYIRKSQDTLRELADDTGGISIVNQNDFDKMLNRIDAEASDYYVLGYYSSNPDPTKRVRSIAVHTSRKDVNVVSRKEYIVKPPIPARPAKR